MSDVIGFDSFDEAMNYIQAQHVAADASMSEEQQSITWGSYWVRFWAGAGEHLVIFGLVTPREEVRAIETAYYEPGDAEGQAELREILTGIDIQHAQNMMYGRCWSVVEPEGELGNSHRASLWPIPEDLFAAAAVAGWDINRLLPADQDRLEAVYQAYRQHMISLGL